MILNDLRNGTAKNEQCSSAMVTIDKTRTASKAARGRGQNNCGAIHATPTPLPLLTNRHNPMVTGLFSHQYAPGNHA
jgi:hypothetical protein